MESAGFDFFHQVETAGHEAHLNSFWPSIAITRTPSRYLNVIIAQTTLLGNQRTALNLRMEQMTASVQLIKALGGGWDVSGGTIQPAF